MECQVAKNTIFNTHQPLEHTFQTLNVHKIKDAAAAAAAAS